MTRLKEKSKHLMQNVLPPKGVFLAGKLARILVTAGTGRCTADT